MDSDFNYNMHKLSHILLKYLKYLKLDRTNGKILNDRPLMASHQNPSPINYANSKHNLASNHHLTKGTSRAIK